MVNGSESYLSYSRTTLYLVPYIHAPTKIETSRKPSRPACDAARATHDATFPISLCLIIAIGPFSGQCYMPSFGYCVR